MQVCADVRLFPIQKNTGWMSLNPPTPRLKNQNIVHLGCFWSKTPSGEEPWLHIFLKTQQPDDHLIDPIWLYVFLVCPRQQLQDVVSFCAVCPGTLSESCVFHNSILISEGTWPTLLGWFFLKKAESLLLANKAGWPHFHCWWAGKGPLVLVMEMGLTWLTRRGGQIATGGVLKC